MHPDIDNFILEHTFSRSTEEKYRRVLVSISQKHNMKNLSALELRDWLDSWGWGESTRWIAYNAIRGFLRWAYGDQHQALKLKIKRGISKPQRFMTFDQAQKLLNSLEPATEKGTRDLAICSLFLDTGLRVSEMCRLECADVDLNTCRLIVKIKGGRWEYANFSPYTSEYISAWLNIRSHYALSCSKLFVSIGGTTHGHGLTREGLGTIVEDWGKRIGLKISPHDLRRTFAILSVEAGAPTRLLQLAGRWSSLDMVEHYTRSTRLDAFRPYMPMISLSMAEKKE